MKTRHILVIIIFLIHTLFLRTGIAQDNNTQWNLPEGAKARLSKGEINGISFSPDGSQIAVGSATGVWLYDARTGAERALLTDHTSRVGPVGFSPDGKTLVSGMYGDILLWDITTGTLLKSIKRQKSRIKWLRILEDSKTLLCENYDDSVQLWDITTGLKKKDFHPASLRGFGGVLRTVIRREVTTTKLYLHKSKDNGIFAIGHKDGKIRLEDAATGQHLKTLQGHEDRVDELVFSPDGTILAAHALDTPVRLWDVTTGHSLITLTEKLGFSRILMFSKDGKTFVGQTKSGEIELWDVATKKLRTRLDGKLNSTIHALAFSPDAKIIAGVNPNGDFRVWDANTGAELFSFVTGNTEKLNALAFSPDSSTLASGHTTTIQFWDTRTFTQLSNRIDANALLSALVFSPDGRTVTTAESFIFNIKKHDAFIKESVIGTMNLWDIRTGYKLSAFGVESSRGKVPVFPRLQRGSSSSSGGMGGTVVFSQNGYMLATALNSERATKENRFTVLLWEVPHGKSQFTLKGHTDKVNVLAFTPNGHTLASGSEDGTIRLWDASTGTQILSLPAGKTNALAFSMDGKTLASISSTFSIQLWDTTTGNQLTTFKGQNGTANVLVFSTDDKILVNGGRNGIIQLWDIDTGNKLSTFKGHAGWIEALVFSPDGKTLASGSQDGAIFLWNVPH